MNNQNITISVITPSFNQEIFLEETIKSVISQKGAFYLEYVIIDGDSADGSVEIIKKYEKLLNENRIGIQCKGIDFKWISEKDDGQAHAINKGFQIAKGDIFCWINSDDLYKNNDVLSTIFNFFTDNPEAWFVYGRGEGIDEDGNALHEEWYVTAFAIEDIKEIDFILQPSTFWKREVFECVGFLNSNYNYVFDWDYWIRCSEHFKFHFIDKILSCYRHHAEAKTRAGKFERYKEILEFLINNDSLTERALNQYIINHNEIVVEKDKEIKQLRKKAKQQNELLKKQKLPSVFYFPFFNNINDIHDQIARASWYLNFLDIERIFFPVNIEQSAPFDLPDYFDPNIKQLFKKIESKVVFLEVNDDESRTIQAFNRSTIVMNWKTGRFPSEEWEKRVQEKKGVWRVDKNKERQEALYYIQVGYANYFDKEVDIEKHRQRFERFFQDTGIYQKSYIFGNGPSVSRYKEFDFSDGIPIICNSLIKDKTFLDYVQPKILVFGDPVFHFGPSLYAAEFRKELVNTINKHDIKILLPFKYLRILIKNLPEIEDRVIGIPSKVKEKVNLNVRKQFYVESTSNIQTLLLLPLAATFSKNIYMLGFDGRKLEDNQYFWKHNKKSQYNEHMDNSKIVHPAFFKLSYNEYYLEHCDTVEKWLKEGEKFGKKYISLTPSYIPALSHRFDITARIDSAIHLNKKYRLISINPDLTDKWGHFLHFDRRVREETIKEGGDFISLSHMNIDASLALEENWIVPLFRNHSWDIRQKLSGAECGFELNRQIRFFIEHLMDADNNTANIFYMYLSDIRFVPHIFEVAVRSFNNKNSYVLNLFYSHYSFFEEDNPRETYEETFKVIFDKFYHLLPTFNIYLSVETKELQEIIHKYTGKRLDIWPFFSTTYVGEEGNIESKTTHTDAEDPNVTQGQLAVCYPGNSRTGKGFNLVYDLVIKALDEGALSNFQFTIRELFNEKEKRKYTDLLPQVDNYAKVIQGVLSSDEYRALIQNSDVILIPYRKSEFYARTSAVFSDSILFGKPVIATSETWAGRLTEEYDIGITFSDGDIDEFYAALVQLKNNYEYYHNNVQKIKYIWFNKNNCSNFIHFLKSCSNDTSYEGISVRSAQTHDAGGPLTLNDILKIINFSFSQKDLTIDEIVEAQKKIIEKQKVMISNRDDGVGNLKSTLEKQKIMIENRDIGIRNLKNEIQKLHNQIKDLHEMMKPKNLVKHTFWKCYNSIIKII